MGTNKGLDWEYIREYVRAKPPSTLKKWVDMDVIERALAVKRDELTLNEKEELKDNLTYKMALLAKMLKYDEGQHYTEESKSFSCGGRKMLIINRYLSNGIRGVDCKSADPYDKKTYRYMLNSKHSWILQLDDGEYRKMMDGVRKAKSKS